MVETKLKEETKSMDENDDAEFYQGKELLTDIETYLKSGVHIGTKFKSGDMRKYVFKKRKDGLIVFNIEIIDQRIRMISKILSQYEGKDIAIVCRRLYGHTPIKKFAAMTGAKAFTGRFVPGTFTNPQARGFHEPKIVILCDPLTDSQALKEASESHLQIIALAGSESPLKSIDLAIPANNKGRKSLALLLYLLTRETLIERKEIDKKSFKVEIEEFEQQIEEKAKRARPSSGFQRRGFRRRY